jgi:tRNA(fMet)-specific endonuclease VapC
MRILIDTNCYSAIDKGDPETIRRIESAQEVWLPFIALGELFSGFELGTQKEENEQQLHEFLSRAAVGVLFADHDTTQGYGRIFHALRRQGTPIPTNDIWIAALALQHDLVLTTSDRHFLNIPDLKILRSSNS